MTDYISREALENWVREEVASLDSKEDREFVIQRWRKEIPAADVAPVVHGRWIMTEYRTEETCWLGWHCSNCGDTYDGLGKLDERKHKYCHHCGAVMDNMQKEVPHNATA